MAPPIEGKKHRRTLAGIPFHLYFKSDAFPNGAPETVSLGALIYQFSGMINNNFHYVYSQSLTSRAGSQLVFPQAAPAPNQQQEPQRTYAPGATHWGSASRVGQNNINR